MDYPRFTTEQAATVAGVPINTVSTWLKRGVISTYPGGSDVPPDVISPGTGRGRLFTRRSVLHITMVARLTRAGLPVDLASMCAMKFLDVGQYGECFAEGGTALVVQIKQAGPDISITTRAKVAQDFFWPSQYRDDPVLILDLDAFVSAADRAIKQL